MTLAIDAHALPNIFMTCALALTALPFLLLFQAALIRLFLSLTLSGWMKLAITEASALYLLAILLPLPIFDVAQSARKAAIFGNVMLLGFTGWAIFLLIGGAGAYTAWHLFGHADKKQ